MSEITLNADTRTPAQHSKPRIALIAAVASNGVIGRNGTLPWHLPADLQHFKALTTGKRIVMGRRTWQSFPRPLPNREHVVISSQALELPEGVIPVQSMEEALSLPNATDTVFVIGGNQAYAAALPQATDVFLTEIDAEVEGDTHFPQWHRQEFDEVSRDTRSSAIAGLGDAVVYSFVHYQRKERGAL